MFWLTVKVQESVGDGVPGHAPITGPPTQKDKISPTVTAGVIDTSAWIHTVSWTIAGHSTGVSCTAVRFSAFKLVSALVSLQPHRVGKINPPFKLL